MINNNSKHSTNFLNSITIIKIMLTITTHNLINNQILATQIQITIWHNIIKIQYQIPEDFKVDPHKLPGKLIQWINSNMLVVVTIIFTKTSNRESINHPIIRLLINKKMRFILKVRRELIRNLQIWRERLVEFLFQARIKEVVRKYKCNMNKLWINLKVKNCH